MNEDSGVRAADGLRGTAQRRPRAARSAHGQAATRVQSNARRWWRAPAHVTPPPTPLPAPASFQRARAAPTQLQRGAAAACAREVSAGVRGRRRRAACARAAASPRCRSWWCTSSSSTAGATSPPFSRGASCTVRRRLRRARRSVCRDRPGAVLARRLQHLPRSRAASHTRGAPRATPRARARCRCCRSRAANERRRGCHRLGRLLLGRRVGYPRLRRAAARLGLAGAWLALSPRRVIAARERRSWRCAPRPQTLAHCLAPHRAARSRRIRARAAVRGGHRLRGDVRDWHAVARRRGRRRAQRRGRARRGRRRGGGGGWRRRRRAGRRRGGRGERHRALGAVGTRACALCCAGVLALGVSRLQC
jgi:hypothetical protein